jgi:hypothetical protein
LFLKSLEQVLHVIKVIFAGSLAAVGEFIVMRLNGREHTYFDNVPDTQLRINRALTEIA